MIQKIIKVNAKLKTIKKINKLTESKIENEIKKQKRRSSFQNKTENKRKSKNPNRIESNSQEENENTYIITEKKMKRIN